MVERAALKMHYFWMRSENPTPVNFLLRANYREHVFF